MKIYIPISGRAKKYGYLFWPKSLDGEMNKVLKNNNSLEVFFENSLRGRKNVDRKNRRISIGYKWTRNLGPDKKYFKVERKGDALKITSEKNDK